MENMEDMLIYVENIVDMVYMDDMKNMVGVLNINEMVDIEDKMDTWRSWQI
jgi:hypothetical protein